MYKGVILSEMGKGQVERRDVFLSHASVDKDCLVRPVAQELMRRGLSVWLDEGEICPGMLLEESIKKGLETANAVAPAGGQVLPFDISSLSHGLRGWSSGCDIKSKALTPRAYEAILTRRACFLPRSVRLESYQPPTS